LCTAATEFKEDLFLKHVIEVGSYVKQQGRIPIIWDDMLRIVSVKKLLESGIGKLVEPMLWVYAEDVDRFINWESWEK
jgi:hexosaminidase